MATSDIKTKIDGVVQDQFRSEELEYQVVAYVARVNSAAGTMVVTEWISNSVLRGILRVLRELGMKVTESLLKQEVVDKGVADSGDKELYEEAIEDLFVTDLEGIDSSNFSRIAENLLRLYESRRIVSFAGEVIVNVDKFSLDRSKDRIRELDRPVSILNPTDAGHYLEDYEERRAVVDERIEQAQDSETGEAGIATGVRRFDLITGGLLPGEFGVVGGTSGVGKTAVLINFALSAWLRGHNVMLVSGEMKKNELAFRVDANLSEVVSKKFRLGELSQEELDKWRTTIDRHRVLNDENVLYVRSFSRYFTADDIHNEIAKVESDTGKKIEMVGIDYLNIMSPNHAWGNQKDWGQQADIVWEVKGLAADRNMVVWTANQVVDDAYDKELFSLSDLKYARAISETAPVVVAYIRHRSDILLNRAKLQILKLRGSEVPRNPIALYPNMDYMRIDDVRHERKTLRGRQPSSIDMRHSKENKKKGKAKVEESA